MVTTEATLLIRAAALAAALSTHAAAEFADPFIGTQGRGHCSPAAARPFGMVQPGGDTGRSGWDYCAGYQHDDREIIGFSQTRLSGAGSAQFGDACIFPLPDASAEKSDEEASPGYYAVTLGGRVRAEATATDRVAFYRFRYMNGERPFLRLDLEYALSGAEGDPPTRVVEVRTNAVSSAHTTGSVRVIGWTDRRYHFAIDRRLAAADELLVKVALSASSVDGAVRNMDTELPGWDFDGTRREAFAEWDRILSRLPFPGGDEGERTMFYTCLYRLCLQPNIISDVGEKPFYSTFSLWDTFRAAHPLYHEICSERVPDFVDSLLRQGRANGYLPIWPMWGQETQWMIGTHSVPVIVDAFLRGVRAGDDAYWRAAYAQVKDTLSARHPARRKEGWDMLDAFGYYPCDIVRGEGVSRLLECTFDDWCAARMARALGESADAEFFMRRAAAWTNVYDRATGFMRGRDSSGNWREPFDPKAVGHNTDTDNDFTEGNAWQWTWHVLHDIPALVEAMGGADKSVHRLDALFSADSKVYGDATTADVTGMIGQYAHGNEPSHHIPFVYAICGRPDKTREIVGEIRRKCYIPRPDGLCGNDDCGQMSAWYIWATLGRYPLVPCGKEGFATW